MLEAYQGRLGADYLDSYRISAARTEEHIRRAEQFLVEVEKLLGG